MTVLLLIGALAVLLISPGLLVSLPARRADDWSAPERAAIAFVCGLALVSPLAWLFYATGLGLTSLTYVMSTVGGLSALAMLYRGYRLGRRLLGGEHLRSHLWPSLALLAFAGVSSGVAAWGGPWLCCTADSFGQIEAVRSMLETGRTLVDTTFYAGGQHGIDPLGTSWHTALAAAAKLTGSDAVSIWDASVPISATVMMLSFYTFARAVLTDRWVALLATLVHFVLFLNLDFRIANYPNTLGYASLWVSLALLVRFSARPSLSLAALVAFLGATLANIHFFMFETFIALAGSYLALAWTVTRLRRSPGAGSYPALAAAVAVAAAGGAAIFFAKSLGTDVLSLDWQGGVGSWQPQNFTTLGAIGGKLSSALSLPDTAGDASPLRWLSGLHLLRPSVVFPSPLHVLGYAAALLLLPRALQGERRAQFLVAASLVVPLLTLNPFAVSALWQRSSDIPVTRLPRVAPLALVISLTAAEALGHLGRTWNARRVQLKGSAAWPAAAAAAFLALAVTASALRAADGVGSIYFDSSDYYSVLSSRRNRLHTDEGVLRYLRDRVDRDAVVLSDDFWSFYIAALTGQRVVYVKMAHWPGNVPLEDNLIRERVVRAVFPEPPRDPMELYDLLNDWHVDYLLVDRARWPGWTAPNAREGSALVPVFADGEAVLYAVTTQAPR